MLFDKWFNLKKKNTKNYKVVEDPVQPGKVISASSVMTANSQIPQTTNLSCNFCLKVEHRCNIDMDVIWLTLEDSPQWPLKEQQFFYFVFPTQGSVSMTETQH